MPAMKDVVLVREEKVRQLILRFARQPMLPCFCVVASPAHVRRAKRVFRIVRRARHKGWILQSPGYMF